MKSFLKTLRNNLIKSIYSAIGFFLSVSVRPITTSKVNYSPRLLSFSPVVSIIIQGPLKLENSFTLDTIRLYKKTLLPTTRIIVSTWEDEDKKTLDELREMDVTVICAQKPENAGILNINYQIASMKNGLAVAKNLGSEYILKTRTDIRIYAPNIEAYLCGLLKSFPPNPAFRQKNRILGLSLNSYLYRMYNISDLVIFGHIDDMTKYWDIPFDIRTEEPPTPGNSLREWSKLRMVETYLTSTYLENVGRTLQWTVADSFQALADHFIIIDEQSLDLFWYKYEYWKEYRKRNYESMYNDVFLTFRDWITLYTGNKYIIDIPEHAVELPFKSKINHD